MTTTHRILVFAGPSLDPSLKHKYPNMCFRGPALQGDIAHESEYTDFDLFLIVDGYYKSVPSIWHKEILYANNNGKIIVGCSSLGALRASEMYHYGMVGCGIIYKWLCDEEIVRDPDVAVAHGPQDVNFQPYTIPIVNIKATLEKSCTSLPVKSIDKFLELCRKIFFEQRTMKSILKTILDSNLNFKLEVAHALEFNYIDQKMIDCTETIEWLSVNHLQWTKCEDVNRTIYFNALMINDTYTSQGISGLDNTKQSVLAFQLLDDPDNYLKMRDKSRLVDFTCWIASVHNIIPSDDDLQLTLSDIVSSLKLNDLALPNYLSSVGLSYTRFNEYVFKIATFRKVKALTEIGNLCINNNSTHYEMMMLSEDGLSLCRGINNLSKTLNNDFFVQKDELVDFVDVIPSPTLKAIGRELDTSYLEKHPRLVSDLVGIPYEFLINFAHKYNFYVNSVTSNLSRLFSRDTN